MFVVDSSGSIGDFYFNNIKTYMKDVVRELGATERGHHVGVVTFSEFPRFEFELTHQDVEGKVSVGRIRVRGGGEFGLNRRPTLGS